MKRLTLHILIWFFLSLQIPGCSPLLKNQPQHVMQQFKYYQRVEVFASSAYGANTDIIVSKNDILLFMASGNVTLNPNRPQTVNISARSCLFYSINDLNQGYAVFRRYIGIHEAKESGRLKFRVVEDNVLRINEQYYRNNTGSFIIDVFVFRKDQEETIPNLLKELTLQNPEDKTFQSKTDEAINEFKMIFAERKTKEEISETSKKIQEIAGKINSEDKAVILSAKNELEIMKAKLAQLTEQLEQLDELKKEFEVKEFREKDLLVQLEKSKQRPPIIFIGSPKSGLKAEHKIINLYGVVEDDKAIDKLEFFINGTLDERISYRGILISPQGKPKRIEFNEKIFLKSGKNALLVKATDSEGFISEQEVVVSYTESRKNIWAVVIGIDNYQNVRNLKYATNDARAFYDYLVKTIKVPEENVSLLLNNNARLYEIRSALGTHLRRKAGKEDMVMIYFAGHGATEEDSLSLDGDGLEKYILPYDADLKNLYASALPMSEISEIFKRIFSERLIFIADSCYSVASGGRTIGIKNIRANISEAFLNRISTGKGRVIITASGANEVSAENEDFKHGVFTYYFLEGLKGKADIDKDGMITVDEVYNYVSINVPKATGQAQHPVKKGSVEGQLIMGIVE